MRVAATNGYRRVVVTGLGVVSSLGIGWQEFWKNLIAGKSGISKVTSFDTSDYERHYGGEIKNFDPAKFMNRRKVKLIGRSSQMAIAASKLALADGRLELSRNVCKRTAVIIGMTMAEMGVLEGFHDEQVKHQQKARERIFSSFPSNSVSSNVGIELKLQGYNRTFSTACAAGNYSVGHAFDLIRTGKEDYALAGGSDRFSRVVFTGFGRLYAIAPEKCQPFDKNRQGMIPGEGAGILLLETLESAQKRNAHIYAEILGYGMSCDANHITHPDASGISIALKRALSAANVKPSEVDYISAHGTGTVENDRAECVALERVFGKKAGGIPVSSVKSMLGHTMGAAAALESIVSCLAIEEGEIPPTINVEEQDPECNIDCVPNRSKKKKIKLVLNNSQAFGGNNAGVILRVFDR